MIETAVIIANWNGKKYLKGCLDSLRAQSYKNFRIIFIDNGSEDDSVDFVRTNYPDVILKEIGKNTGFAAGYNLGFRLALKDENIKWLVALNNDTKVDEDYFQEMVNCAKRHPDAGSIQPKILNFYDPEKIDCAGITIAKEGTAHNRGFGEKDKGQFEEEKEIFGANATAALYDREALEKTKQPVENFFDRDFFAYYEDVDLAWRMKLLGYRSYYCPSAKVFHMHSGTSGKFSSFKAFYLHRNYFFAVLKNYPLRLLLKTLFFRFFEYMRLVYNAISGKKREREYIGGEGKVQVAKIILRAWRDVLKNFPKLLKKRRIIQKNRKASNADIKKWLKKFNKN
ncbi:MAG: glycosyltransferase family 2 protein [Candidatus Moranbacteria bacterium]|nr:glycosyltransferase family 2 protein [Candidatus Moranbacteria bacterium]